MQKADVIHTHCYLNHLMLHEVCKYTKRVKLISCQNIYQLIIQDVLHHWSHGTDSPNLSTRKKFRVVAFLQLLPSSREMQDFSYIHLDLLCTLPNSRGFIFHQIHTHPRKRILMAMVIVDQANNDVVIESYCEAEVCTCKLIIFLKIIKENLAPTGKI